MTDPWPANLPHGVIDFEPVGGGRSGGAFAGLAPAVGPASGGPHWRASVSQLPLISSAAILAARALEGILDGGAGSVFVPACDGRLRPTVSAAAFGATYARGETDVLLTHTGDPLTGGEHFSAVHEDETVGRRMYRIVQVLSASPFMVRITPHLRAAVDTGTVIDFSAPSCPMRLESGFDLPIELGRFGDVQASFVEYFDRSPAPEVVVTPDPPETDMRYWRVRAIHTHDGDVLFSPADFRFLDDFAGSNMSGTPISSALQGGTILADVFDVSGFTFASFAGSGGWVGEDMGAPTPRTKEFYLTARFGSPSQMPSDLAYEESEDGVTWSTVKTWTGMPAWIENERRFFAIDDEANAPWDGASPAQWRRQRVRALTVGAGVFFGAGELWFLDVIGGSTPISGTYRGYLLASGDPAGLLDNNFTTTAAVFLSPGGWFWVDNGLSPRDQVVQLRLTSQFFNPEQSPLTFVLEGENWAGDWQLIQSFTTTAWPSDVARRFNV